MGFITRAFSVLAGSEEFPTGSGYVLRVQRSKVLLTKSVQCIIAANQGWVLDTNRNPTDTDYTDIPPSNPSDDVSYPGLFLRNNISGCKMFISYFSCYYGGIKNFDGKSIITIQNGTTHNGLIISIIPEGSDKEFGDPTTTTFLPSDATRLFGTMPYVITRDAAYDPPNNYGFEYTFGVTPYCIFVYATHNDQGAITDPETYLAVPVYACGRILESVAHGEKTTNAKYGVIPFRVKPGDWESWCTVYNQTIKNISGDDVRLAGMMIASENEPYGFGNTGCSVSRYNGEWISGSDGDNYKVIFYAVNPNLLTFNQVEGNIVWSSLCVYVHTNDLTTYNIVPNDGFKGILDTTLFRAISYGTRGQTFDNEKFICPESNVGWLIGWSPSNEPLLQVDLVLGVRWDPTNNVWLAKTFSDDGDWWGGLQSSSDANTLSALGVSYSTNSSDSQWAGTVGSILYDTNHIFEIIELYSDMGTTPIEWDKNNFYVENNNPFRESGSDYNNRALLIASFNALSTEVKSWKVRIKKKKPTVDGVVYLSANKQPVSINSSFSQNVYDEEGDTIPLASILEGGDRYIILNYYTSIDDISGSWDPKIYLYSLSGNLVLQNDSGSAVTIQRVTYRLVENPPPPPPEVLEAYFSSNKSPVDITYSSYKFIFDGTGTSLKIEPEKSYLPKKYILSDESEIVIPSADATKTYFYLTSNQDPGLSIYHTVTTTINNLVRLVYETRPATLITAWVSADKTAQTVGPWSPQFLYDEDGNRIIRPDGLIVVAYYYVNGEKIYNNDLYVRMSDYDHRLRISAKADIVIEKIEYNVQPVPTYV